MLPHLGQRVASVPRSLPQIPLSVYPGSRQGIPVPSSPRPAPPVISNGAGRFFLPHSLLQHYRTGHRATRHYERSRPIFSSAFAPANASAYAERNLSSLRALRRGLFTLSGAEGPRPCASAVLQWI